jgi:Family of unknown function (DUF6150)
VNLKKRSMVSLLLTFLLLNSSLIESAESAGPSPKFNVGCFDYSTTGIDSGGRYIEYQPSVTANFYGKKATINTYLNDTLTNTLKFSRNSSSYSRIEKFELKVKIYRDQVNLGKNEFKLIFRDSQNRSQTWRCQTEFYESSFGKELLSGSAGGGGVFGSKISGCRLNGKKLYGSVYFTNSAYLADFSIYITNSSYLADLKVYLTNSSYLATSCGLWYPTNSSYLADFSVYITNSSYLADFSVYQTTSSYLAGT